MTCFACDINWRSIFVVAGTLTEMDVGWVYVCQELFCLILYKVSNPSGTWISFLASSLLQKCWHCGARIKYMSIQQIRLRWVEHLCQKFRKDLNRIAIQCWEQEEESQETVSVWSRKTWRCLNSSPEIITGFHYPTNTSQQIFLMLYASFIMFISPFINQTLCTTLYILTF